MLIDRYAEAMFGKLNQVLDTQRRNIEDAAEIIVNAVEKGHNVHVYDSGHIINSELINRAGGLALLKALKYTLTVEDPVRDIDREGNEPSILGIGKIVMSHSKAAPGDVLIMGSVSGKAPNLVDIALAAKEMGLTLIVVTSLEYSGAVKSEHTCGKKIYELADLVIDNCAPKGDAMLEVEGATNKFGPASGMTAAFAMWCVSAEVIDRMIARGMEPTLFRSINFPGGWDDYYKMCDKYNETGK